MATLVTGPGDSIENVVRQLRRLRQAGIRFSLATGRTIAGASKILREMMGVRSRMPAMIAYNGAVVAQPQAPTVIQRLSIDAEAYRYLISKCQACGAVPLVYTCKQWQGTEPIEEVYGQASVFYRPELDFNGMHIRWIDDLSRLDTSDAAAILVSDALRTADLAALATDFLNNLGEHLRITSSGGVYLEIAHPDGNKRSAMRLLASGLGLSTGEIMAIGDNFNDAEMIAEAGVGVAVANAPSEIRSLAQFVCSRPAAEGVVEALRYLLSSVRHRRIRQRPRGLED